MTIHPFLRPIPVNRDLFDRIKVHNAIGLGYNGLFRVVAWRFFSNRRKSIMNRDHGLDIELSWKFAMDAAKLSFSVERFN